MDEADSLASLSAQFAEKLTAIIKNSLDEFDGGFESITYSLLDEGTKSVVEQSQKHGIMLRVNAVPLLALKVKFECQLDGQGIFLAVRKSSIKAYGGSRASGEPLFCYE